MIIVLRLAPSARRASLLPSTTIGRVMLCVPGARWPSTSAVPSGGGAAHAYSKPPQPAQAKWVRASPPANCDLEVTVPVGAEPGRRLSIQVEAPHGEVVPLCVLVPHGVPAGATFLARTPASLGATSPDAVNGLSTAQPDGGSGSAGGFFYCCNYSLHY